MSERNDTPAADAAKPVAATPDAKPEVKAEAKSDTPAETKPKTEMPRAAQLSGAPKSESPKPEAQKADAPRIANLPVLHKPPVKEKQGRRFALLAATVAFAACGGAIAGSLGSVGIERALAPAPAAQPIVSAAPDQTGAEIKALKEQVAQLRVTARQLSESLAAARATMGQSHAATTGQLTKITEVVDRIEKNERKEAERRAQAPQPAPQPAAQPAPQPAPQPAAQQQAAAPASDVTGSITPPAPAAAGKIVLPVVRGWTLRRVVDGSALVAGPLGLIEIEPGERIPGLGKIEDVRREDGRWIVITQKGVILPR